MKHDVQMLGLIERLFGKDRRRWQRYAVRSKVALGVPGRRTPLVGLLRDISAGGCLFQPREEAGFLSDNAMRLNIGKNSIACRVIGRSERGLHCEFVRPLSQAQLDDILGGLENDVATSPDLAPVTSDRL